MLGEDVVVLQSRRVKRKGFGGLLGSTEFEIRAGAPVRNLPDPPPSNKGTEMTWSPHMPFANRAYDDEFDQRSPRTRSHHEKLEDEVRAMRAMLFRMSRSPSRVESELASLRRAMESTGSPGGASTRRMDQLLSNSGIDGDTARQLTRTLRQHNGDDASLYDAYRDALADLVQVKSWPLAKLAENGPRIIGVVGPPGVGKTTTVAKLAARAISEENQSITLISADTYRIGAVDQLKQYAKLLRCKLFIVKSAEALHKAIRSAQTDVVLVDTAGRGPDDENSVEAALGEGRMSRDRPTGWEHMTRHVLLCLDASLRSVDAQEVWRKYAICNPTAVAVTKLDLTNAPGGLIHGPAASELPVSALCMGQRVPEDIAPATAGAILDYLAPKGCSRLAS